MKILLLHPISRFKNIKEDREGVGYPTGIAYIGSYLKQWGHEVTILDNNQKCYSKEKLIRFLRESDCEVVGIGAMVNSYNQVLQLSKLVKQTKDCPVILGGPMATYSPKVILENMDVDVCVLGEGEETSAELFEKWPDYYDVPGIAYLDRNGKFVRTPPRICKKARDEYPYPGYDDGLLDISNYWRGTLVTWETHIRNEKLMRNYRRRADGIKIATMVTAMGCPYQCTFCTNSTDYNKARIRTPENVAKEAQYLKDKYGVGGIRFDDDLLILMKDRTLELCRELKKTGLLWSGQSVGRATADEEVVKALAESGCVGYGIGIESGSDYMLKLMKKGSRARDYKAAYENAIKYGLGVRVQLLYGIPGETVETLQETIDFFKETGMPPRRFNRLLPMPGSELYDQCVAQGIITNEHDYLNITSLLAGYTSRSILFNITEMTDEEYEENMEWVESTMYGNYERQVKSDPMYWYYLGTHVLRKIIQIKPVLRRIAKVFSRDPFKWHSKRIVHDSEQVEKYVREEFVNYYPELFPDPEKKGFINKPLKQDERMLKSVAMQFPRKSGSAAAPAYSQASGYSKILIR